MFSYSVQIAEIDELMLGCSTMFECVLLPSDLSELENHDQTASLAAVEELISSQDNALSTQQHVSHKQYSELANNLHEELIIKEEVLDGPFYSLCSFSGGEHFNQNAMATSPITQQVLPVPTTFEDSNSGDLLQDGPSHTFQPSKAKNDMDMRNKFVLNSSTSSKQRSDRSAGGSVRQERHCCEICCDSFNSNKSLQNHIVRHHLNAQPVVCLNRTEGLCPGNLSNRENFIDNENAKFCCLVCDYKANAKSTMMKHLFETHCIDISLNSVKKQNKIMYACKTCVFKTHTKSELVIHSQIHDVFKLKCIHCDIHIFNKTELDRHIKISHGGEDKRIVRRSEHSNFNFKVSAECRSPEIQRGTETQEIGVTDCENQGIRDDIFHKSGVDLGLEKHGKYGRKTRTDPNTLSIQTSTSPDIQEIGNINTQCFDEKEEQDLNFREDTNDNETNLDKHANPSRLMHIELADITRKPPKNLKTDYRTSNNISRTLKRKSHVLKSGKCVLPIKNVKSNNSKKSKFINFETRHGEMLQKIKRSSQCRDQSNSFDKRKSLEIQEETESQYDEMTEEHDSGFSQSREDHCETKGSICHDPNNLVLLDTSVSVVEDNFLQDFGSINEAHSESKENDNETNLNYHFDKGKEIVINDFIREITNRVFYCIHCDMTLTTLRAIYEHGETVHTHINNRIKKRTIGQFNTNGQHRCGLCNACFKLFQNLMFHKLKHRGIFPITCKFCHKFFSEKRSLHNHYLRFHFRNIEFEVNKQAPGAVESEISYQPEVQIDVNQDEELICPDNDFMKYILVCTICYTVFNSFYRLFEHCMQEHNSAFVIPITKQKCGSNGPYTCNLCNTRYADVVRLRDHLLRHFDIEPFMCKTCGLTFNNRSSMTWHSTLNHKSKIQKKSCEMFTCDQCKWKCSSRKQLISHMKKIHLYLEMKRQKVLESLGSGYHPSKLSVGLNCKIMPRSQIIQTFYPKLSVTCPPKKYVCNLCNVNFSKLILLHRHAIKSHDVIVQKVSLKIQIPHPSQRFKCSHCKKRFNAIHSLQIHELNHRGVKPFACDMCDLAYTHQNALIDHKKLEHPLEWSKHMTKMKVRSKRLKGRKETSKLCESVESNVPSQKTQDVKLSKTGSQKRPSKSNNCDETLNETSISINVTSFETTTSIKLSEQNHNNHSSVPSISSNPEKVFQCYHCKGTYTRKSQLAAHMSGHIMEISLICQYCSEKSKTVKDYQVHACNIQKYPFMCTHCSLRFPTKILWQVHRNSHPRNIPCDVCGQKYKSLEIVAQHKLRYHRSPRFLCNECGDTFGIKGHFEKHLQLHKDMKHKCEFCEKIFWSYRKMQRHRNLEHKEKHYICGICGAVLSQKWHYAAHLRNHAGTNKKYNCSKCEKVYKCLSGLKYHYTKAHPEI